MPNTPLSSFSERGLDVGADERNMTYLYGLSDFFTFIFEDTNKTNLMLEANAVKASDIYSHFLQLSSSISLASIQEDVGTSIKLILVKETDFIDDGLLPFKYNINVNEVGAIAGAKYLANRPFLPTETLENGVHFRFELRGLNDCILFLSKPIEDFAFSRRILSSDVVEYALWATDVAIDEQLMYKHYGRLLGVKPEVSSEQFSNFIYGLYYLYLNGPTLKVMEQGLNLVLGIPLPRKTSEVLDIRYKVDTGQYVIITEDREYLLPLGVIPQVGIGDILEVGGTIARWIELKDYVSDGKWWINVSIPESIIRHLPKSQLDRFAKEGNRYDYLMSEFLFRNTFLIRVNVGSFKDNVYFDYLSEILSGGKPGYAQPVFVWRIDMNEDEFGFIEELNFTITQIISQMRTINSVPLNTLTIN